MLYFRPTPARPGLRAQSMRGRVQCGAGQAADLLVHRPGLVRVVQGLRLILSGGGGSRCRTGAAAGWPGLCEPRTCEWSAVRCQGCWRPRKSHVNAVRMELPHPGAIGFPCVRRACLPAGGARSLRALDTALQVGKCCAHPALQSKDELRHTQLGGGGGHGADLSAPPGPPPEAAGQLPACAFMWKAARWRAPAKRCSSPDHDGGAGSLPRRSRS